MILFMGIPLEENDHDFMEALYLRYIALMRYAATRLWRDDLAYAECRYRVRTGAR